MLKSQSKIKVMIVEDDPMVRRINEEFLEKLEGFVLVGSYGDILKAKEAIVNKKPELLLLDIFFPNGQGTELLTWLRGSKIETDVIFITADRSTASIEEAKRYGAFDYLIKPFRFHRFEEALKKYLSVRTKFTMSYEFDQDQVDDLMIQPLDTLTVMSEEELHLKNHKCNKTCQQIYFYMKKHHNDFFSANVIGEKLGISRITARRYLESLEYEGYIELELNYGSVGRPQNYYKVKAELK